MNWRKYLQPLIRKLDYRLAYLKYFLNTQQWSYAELQAHQAEMLEAKWGLHDLTGEPLRTKQDYMGFKPRNPHIAKQTSGSTGTPFLFYVPLHWRPVALSLQWRWFLQHGVWGERFFFLTRGPIERKPQRKVFNWLLNIEDRCDYFNITRACIARFKHFKPKFLRANTSAVYHIARALEAEGISGVECTAFVGSESLLPYETFLTRFFKATFQYYGGAEFGEVAYECPYHTFHVNMETCLVESVKGELVVTDFVNDLMPFLRYRTGDRGVVTRKHCKCGRDTDIILDLEGRISEFWANPYGRDISWWLASPLTAYHAVLQQWQVAIVGGKQIELRIIPRRTFREAVLRLQPYVTWAKQETGLNCLIRCVDEFPYTLKPQLLRIEAKEPN